MTVLSPPIPAFQNFPIQSQNYQPSVFVISAMALGQLTTVTTSVNHNYVIGQLCRLIIPYRFGCRQLNGKTGYVVSIPETNQVVLNINSSVNVDPFVSLSYIENPQIVAVGDVNNGYINPNGRNNTLTGIPGSFINIS